MLRRVLVWGGGILLVLVAVAATYIGRTAAPVATGYAAKIVCSGHFVSGRTPRDVQGDLPDNPLTPFIRTATDDSESTTTANLFGVWSTTAWFTNGNGCTLADDHPGFTEHDASPPRDAEWPAGDTVSAEPGVSDPAALASALDDAFSEADASPDASPDAPPVKGTRAVVVVHEGRIVAERYAEGFDADTPLLGWSMSKSIASAAVGRLVGQGVLSLDDDELVAAWEDDRAAITVDQLLHMASGLEFEEIYDVGTTATEMLFTPGSTAAVAAAQPLVAEPGTRWSYSSGTSNILCEVARDAGGFEGPEMIDELIFDPLGMDSAVMEPDATGLPVCSSFTYATARDWARFGLLYARDGMWMGERLLPEGWVDYTTTPVALDNELPYGAHWWLNTGADGTMRMPTVPADAFWASGNEGQQVVVIPSEDLVVVRLGLSIGYDGIAWGLEPLLQGVLTAIG